MPTDTSTRAIIASISNKGGVGKSVTTKALALLYRELGKTVAVYDGDGLVGGLLPALGTRSEKRALQRNQDPTIGCGYYDFRSDQQAAQFLDVIGDLPDVPLFLHDLPGGSLRQFSQISDGGEEGEVSALLDALDNAGVRLKLVMTLSHLLPATESVGTICSVFGDRVDYVAVLNRVWAKPDEFVFWNDAGRKEKKLFEELGGVEIELPAIPAGAFAKSEAYHIHYNNAADHQDLKLSERSQLQGFWRKWREAVEPAAEVLGLR
jgi:hypothetical protein